LDKYEMVVIIVLIVVVASLLRTWIRHRPAGGAAPGDDARWARLEERVKALETIVGDSSYELKQKFRELEK
jgi:hypothetical protein